MLALPDAVLLARIQFGFTISFHIVFPAFTIGLSGFIATLLARAMWSGEERFRILARFWTKIFAVSFAMGVVSGIVLSYQFGSNWSRFSVVVGNIVGPLMGYEVLTAFFLEATFLGILLFGWDRFSPRLHLVAAIMVALGTCVSAFWILSANSWMQFPVGHEMRDGIAHPVDWLTILFNPTFPYRLAHMLTAAYLTTSVVVMAVGARYALVGKHRDHARAMLHMGLGMVALLSPLQLVIGDWHGLSTAKHQPAKLAAMEGHWDGEEIAPLILFAWPNRREERNDYQISIPKLGAFIITHDWQGKFKGLKDFPREDRPPVAPVFFAFRLMVGIGLLLIALGLSGAFLWLRGRLDRFRPWLSAAALSWPLGFIAIIAGWMTTEVGRQPWLATGILRTADAASPVSAAQVAWSLALFVFVYGVVFSMGIFYINRLIDRGPATHLGERPAAGANRPLAAAEPAMRDSTGGGG